MVDAETVAVYNRDAATWVEARTADNRDGAAWVNEHQVSGRVIDLGCGPGWLLDDIDGPATGVDASTGMLAIASRRAEAAGSPFVGVAADAYSLPFRSGSLGGAIASRVHLHLPAADNPLAFADLHRALAADAPVFCHVLGSPEQTTPVDARPDAKFGGRLFSVWAEATFADVIEGAGFDVDSWATTDPDPDHSNVFDIRVKLRRRFTLADTVGPDMTMLICGLNPSIYSAETGVGFGRPGNRFWPAALAADIVSCDRDPRHALIEHGIGMTDLVKRPTRKAAELDAAEYRDGLARVERMAEWLQPKVVCFVGLSGWRTAVDGKARAGWQERKLGGCDVYLMPSTSGLNASSQLPDLTEHLRTAAQRRS